MTDGPITRTVAGPSRLRPSRLQPLLLGDLEEEPASASASNASLTTTSEVAITPAVSEPPTPREGGNGGFTAQQRMALSLLEELTRTIERRGKLFGGDPLTTTRGSLAPGPHDVVSLLPVICPLTRFSLTRMAVHRVGPLRPHTVLTSSDLYHEPPTQRAGQHKFYTAVGACAPPPRWPPRTGKRKSTLSADRSNRPGRGARPCTGRATDKLLPTIDEPIHPAALAAADLTTLCGAVWRLLNLLPAPLIPRSLQADLVDAFSAFRAASVPHSERRAGSCAKSLTRDVSPPRGAR